MHIKSLTNTFLTDMSFKRLPKGTGVIDMSKGLREEGIPYFWANYPEGSHSDRFEGGARNN